jgi:antitoxin CcdA
MRMSTAHVRHRPTNVSLPASLVDRARALGINLSGEFEIHLERVVREREAALWRKENARAIQAYARYVEKHGVWDEDSRGW